MDIEEFIETYPLTALTTAVLAGFMFTAGRFGRMVVGHGSSMLGPAGGAISVAATILPSMAKRAVRDSAFSFIKGATDD